MASTSPEALARDLLNGCLRGERWPGPAVDALRGSEALISIVAEGLSDRFEPRLCDLYAELFAEAFRLGPEAVERYRRVRRLRRLEREPRRVVVLSRVTLGADVAITSVFLDAARRAFPSAVVELAAPRKNWELFGGPHLPVTYRRSDPLAHLPALRQSLSEPGTVVIDPDSRLTQLGLIEICPEENYYFFESRGWGGDSDAPLGQLAERWSEHVFGVRGTAFVNPVEIVEAGPQPFLAVSLGVGGNPAKRLPDPFEAELMQLLAAAGWRVWIDRGAGGEETARVSRAAANFPPDRLRVWEGSFAGFASLIGQSRQYLGYDSAGQHVAAALGTPLITIFTGFPVERMFERWRPYGKGQIDVVRPDRAAVLEEIRRRLAQP